MVEGVGAKKAFNYKTTDFSVGLAEASGGGGADVVLDFVGGPYLDMNLKVLSFFLSFAFLVLLSFKTNI